MKFIIHHNVIKVNIKTYFKSGEMITVLGTLLYKFTHLGGQLYYKNIHNTYYFWKQ